MIDDHKALELNVGASLDEIKAAYARLKKSWDPNNFGYSPRQQIEAQEELKMLNEAYSRLRNLDLSKQRAQTTKNQLDAGATSAHQREGVESLNKNSLFIGDEIPFYRTIAVTSRSLIRSSVIGEIERRVDDKRRPEGYRGVSDWLGERFVFLPDPKKFPSQAHRDISTVSDPSKSLSYEQYVGRVAIVTKITCDVTKHDAWEVELRLEDTGEIVIAKTFGGNIHGLASVADIENARSAYIGKTLWVSASPQAFDEERYVELISTGGHPVVVLDVVAGWQQEKPVRFIVETLFGRKGFVDVSISGTNSPELSVQRHLFATVFRCAVRSPGSMAVIGNRRTRIYHLLTCRNSKDVAQRNRIMFSSREDAEAASYRAGRNCGMTETN